MSFSCPLCHARLTRSEKSYACPQGHQFDMAKEGYVNLLPVQHKRSRDPGDSAEMMQARRAFLDAGHYQPLREAVAQLLEDNLTDSAAGVLDIGCGEGYYTERFAEVAQEKGAQTFGLDVSKVAIRAAAKRYSGVTFCVASSHRLPFDAASMDAVIRIYAPCKAQELARVIKPGCVRFCASGGVYAVAGGDAGLRDEPGRGSSCCVVADDAICMAGKTGRVGNLSGANNVSLPDRFQYPLLAA